MAVAVPLLSCDSATWTQDNENANNFQETEM
jgi:hypothetical protein